VLKEENILNAEKNNANFMIKYLKPRELHLKVQNKARIRNILEVTTYY